MSVACEMSPASRVGQNIFAENSIRADLQVGVFGRHEKLELQRVALARLEGREGRKIVEVSVVVVGRGKHAFGDRCAGGGSFSVLRQDSERAEQPVFPQGIHVAVTIVKRKSRERGVGI